MTFAIFGVSILLGLACVGCGKASAPIQAEKPWKKKAIHEMSPPELGEFVTQMAKETPDLRQRVVAIARRNLDQPYKISLLGEFPFELRDSDPLYCFDSGDCVVFTEQLYAMALAHSWETFFALLQRIRYKNGEISVLTRNHYMLADWNENNSWLVGDITSEISEDEPALVVEEIDRRTFFRNTFDIVVDVPLQKYETSYIPASSIKHVVAKLENGDCVNIIRRKNDGREFCGHVGIIAIGVDGTVNFIDSTQPKSAERPLVGYVEEQIIKNEQRQASGRDVFLGMKFLRLRSDPIGMLLKIDGPDAPVITGPKGLFKRKNG